MEILIVPGVLALVLAVWVVGGYNGLVRGRNHCDESWSAIDTELKRRYDLIPNLVETVKGYAAHERGTIEAVTRARAAAIASTGSPASQAADENALIGQMRTLFAVAERYPDLKANQNFLKLQEELAFTEDRIQRARRFYNANVRDQNNRVQAFPSNLLARIFGFAEREFFEIEDSTMRAAPKVSV